MRFIMKSALPVILCATPTLAHRCPVCDAPTQKVCSGCHRVHYCGAEHQSQDWPAHRLVCTAARADQAGAGAGAGAAVATVAGTGAGAGAPVESKASRSRAGINPPLIAIRHQDNRLGQVGGSARFFTRGPATRNVALILVRSQGGKWDYLFSHDQAEPLSQQFFVDFLQAAKGKQARGVVFLHAGDAQTSREPLENFFRNLEVGVETLVYADHGTRYNFTGYLHGDELTVTADDGSQVHSRIFALAKPDGMLHYLNEFQAFLWRFFAPAS